ncbi:MAG: hypothetical protein IPI23_00960 [Bacteroidetes bacterium]|nr:hypothetical protein [Bacteroidota bacterium]
MTTTKKRAYILLGNKPTLKQITDRTPICVIPGTGKNLRLKLGEDEGITNVQNIDDSLTCFIPDFKSCQFRIMSIIIDEFDLNHQKEISTDPREFEEMKATDDFVNGFTKIALNYDDHNTVFENVFASNMLPETGTNTNSKYQTHFIIKGMKLSFNRIIENTNLEAFSNDTNHLCLKYGEDIGITNAKSVYDNVEYITSELNSNVEPMMHQVAKAFNLKVICIFMPIASDSTKIRFDEDFFSNVW